MVAILKVWRHICHLMGIYLKTISPNFIRSNYRWRSLGLLSKSVAPLRRRWTRWVAIWDQVLMQKCWHNSTGWDTYTDSPDKTASQNWWRQLDHVTRGLNLKQTTTVIMYNDTTKQRYWKSITDSLCIFKSSTPACSNGLLPSVDVRFQAWGFPRRWSIPEQRRRLWPIASLRHLLWP